MVRDRDNVSIMDVAHDSDAFFNWHRHGEFDHLPDAAARFLLEETTNATWTIEELVEDFTRRL